MLGDFDCLKAAVQNGANAVYLGASQFSARASAKNFDLTNLKEAINYATIRNVSVHLALNTLIKNDEFQDALDLAKFAYENGVSAIIVQDFGLASMLIKYFPQMSIHASTQMSIHNLNGAKELETLGFNRAVLARELSINEIEFIKNESNIQLECFIHGALCISYSGQCLFSSMIGGRSGNRGKCAQVCRLPYSLLDSNSNKTLDNGYILSPRDLCGLSFIPYLIDIGVDSLKIEGRMKNPEYVATVTRIYRKYIDLALSGNKYVINKNDLKDLQQVFNRGGFSTGHFESEPNKHLIFKDKPNNMGIYIGNVAKYNSTHGHITLNLNDNIKIGDTISLEHESSKYFVSELMINKKNIDSAYDGQLVTIGRMKGNIKPGDKIYKLESKTLSLKAKESYSKEHTIRELNCDIVIKNNLPIKLKIYDNDLEISFVSKIIPMNAINQPITKERIVTQFSKTGNTPFCFKNINIELDSNLYLPISDINELRRTALEEVKRKIISDSERKLNNLPNITFNENKHSNVKPKLSLYLAKLNTEFDYSLLKNVDCVYIPLKYFENNDYANAIKSICDNFSTYIYMPHIIKTNYRNLFINAISKALSKYNISGFIVPNLGVIDMLKQYINKYDFVGNYTLNVYNNISILEYEKLGINRITLSPELNETDIEKICKTSNVKKELIVYGKTPVMTCGYCFLGKSNKCYPECNTLCKSKDSYYLKDRLGMNFEIVPDNLQTITTIYNSKITSISYSNLDIDFARIDILDENIDEINEIINIVKDGKRLEGKDYTNGNFIRNV